jgi:hypothetical protein
MQLRKEMTRKAKEAQVNPRYHRQVPGLLNHATCLTQIGQISAINSFLFLKINGIENWKTAIRKMSSRKKNFLRASYSRNLRPLKNQGDIRINNPKIRIQVMILNSK